MKLKNCKFKLNENMLKNVGQSLRPYVSDQRVRIAVGVSAAIGFMLLLFALKHSDQPPQKSQHNQAPRQQQRNRFNGDASGGGSLFNRIDATADGRLTAKEIAWAIERRVKSHMQK